MDMNEIVDIVHDAEASGLLDDSTVDYTASPWKVKDTFKMHIVSVQEFPSGDFLAFYDGPKIALDGSRHTTMIDGKEYVLEDYEPIEYQHFPLAKFKDYVKKRKIRKAIAHNGINYDLLAYKAFFGLDYTIQETGDTWAGNKVDHVDTMVLSKTLNPDRIGGHSLGNIAKSAGGVQKKEFRYHMPESERFKHFAADMLYYNLFDLKSNKSVYDYLIKEKGAHDWDSAITTEKCIADIITRQSHRGFAFNTQLAEKNVKELDIMMHEARVKVEPILPAKQATKAFMKDFTPPKKQYNKDGSLSQHMENFIQKIEAKKIENEGKVSAIIFQDKTYELPLEEGKALVTEVPATLNDTTHIKEWLVSLGWAPSEYKEKDLTLKTGTKIKLTPEEYSKTVDKYVEQTLNSSFMADRCEFLGCKPHDLRTKLLSIKGSRGMRVRTNPSFTKGQEKEMCANLEAMGAKFPFASDIVKYLTYKHRRNSILGGGADWDDEEEAEKGFISAVRADGRIPTPADTCGAATSRMKHRLVANIPRVTSLYGEPMRSMFTADSESCYQIGYDFASLEAVIESHYCHKYEVPVEDGIREYCESLLQEKPNDVHTKMAQKISGIIGKKFERGNAKSVKYGCIPMHTKVLTRNGWKYFSEINEGDELPTYNAEKGVVEMDTVLHKHFFKDKELFKFSNKYDKIECTEDHRWYGWRRSKTRNKPSKKVFGFFETREMTQEHNIVLTAPWLGSDTDLLTKEDCALLGWMASDGYWRWSDKGEGTSCSFGKKKEVIASLSQADSKFWKEIEYLLDKMGVNYSKRCREVENGNTINMYKINSAWMRGFLDRVLPGRKNKHEVDWTSFVMKLSRSNLEAFYDSFYMGDGCVTGGHETISQNLGNIFDGITTAAQLLGKGRVSFNKISGSVSPMKSIRVQKRKHITCQELTKESLGIQDTFCLTTKNSSFIIWQDDFIGITGNCTYGAQAAKVAKTIGSDIEVGQQVFDAFWEAAAPLKKLKDALQKHWENNDKKYILTIDGRKVPTRAAHAILNSLFQSAGVICAKKTMIVWERKLRDHGLLVDFWTEDWRNKLWAQQMIAYHDEAQVEVSKELVKFKLFSDKESCNTFRRQQLEDHGKIWAEAHESPKGGWFTAYSLPGQLVVEAVKETTEFYNLNCPLSADYVLGTSWADCH